jgi:ABC-type multidrug transport system ATPase subunit
LSAISGRRRDKKGILKINNTVVTDEDVRNVSGYLHQEDIFTQYLTPREHLEFMVIEQAISKVGGTAPASRRGLLLNKILLKI